MLKSENLEIIEAKEFLTDRSLQKVLAASVYNPTQARMDERAKRYSDSKFAVFAAIYDQKICGVIIIEISRNNRLTILDFAVSEPLRGQGIGTALIRHLQLEYTPSEICAQTDDDAVGFYRKLGFVIEKEPELYTDTVRYHCAYFCGL